MFKPPKQLLPFLSILSAHSNNVYVVGGAVRDLLNGKPPNDWDLVTDLHVKKLNEIFKKSGFSTKETGVEHLVLNVYFGNYAVEISNFRKDKHTDGRNCKPVVGTMTEDSFRRDFTVNSVYLNAHLETSTFSHKDLVDPTEHGIKDSFTKTLRFIGNPKDRIKEDYLRVWRAYRFISKGYTPTKTTLKAVREMYTEAHAKTTPERIRNEIEKMIF